MITRIRTMIRHDEGATAVEYGLLIAGIAAIIVAIVFTLGRQVQGAFQTTSNCISSSGTSC